MKEKIRVECVKCFDVMCCIAGKDANGVIYTNKLIRTKNNKKMGYMTELVFKTKVGNLGMRTFGETMSELPTPDEIVNEFFDSGFHEVYAEVQK